MDKENERSQHHNSFIFNFIISSVALVCVVTFVIILALQDLSGFGASISLTVSTCTHSYYSTKYSNVGLILKVISAAAVLNLFSSIGYSSLLLYLLIKQPSIQQTTLIKAYLCMSVACISGIILEGWPLTLLIQKIKMESCTLDVQLSNLIILVSLAGVLQFSYILQFCFLSKLNQISSTFREQSNQIIKTNLENTEQNLKENIENYHQSIHQRCKVNEDRYTSQFGDHNRHIRYYPEKQKNNHDGYFLKSGLPYHQECTGDKRREDFISRTGHLQESVNRDVYPHPTAEPLPRGEPPIIGEQEPETSQQSSQDNGYMKYLNVLNNKSRRSSDLSFQSSLRHIHKP